MLTHLSIQNFRGLKNFSADLASVTALLGPNSSGKTTVLHAIRVACEAVTRALESDYKANVFQKNSDGKDWIDLGTKVLVGDHKWWFVDQKVGRDVAITIQLDFEPRDVVRCVWVQVECGNNEQLLLSVNVLSPEIVERAGIGRRLEGRGEGLKRDVREHAPRAVLVPPFYGTVVAEEYRARAAIDRMLGSGDQSHVVRNLVVGLDSQRFDRLNAFLGELLRARITKRTSGDATQNEPTLSVYFSDTNGELEISAAGAGFVNIVALYTALSRWSQDAERRPVIFLLDEPEAHLHPRLQAECAAGLARLVTQEFNAQLLLATHSVDILNRLSQQGSRLLRCDRAVPDSVQVLDTDASLFDDLAAWVDLTPYTAINFLASRRVLFVEGKDDLAILPILGELRFRHDPVRLARFRRWAIVAFRGSGNANLGGLLSRLVRNDVVRAGAQNQPFEVIVVLDRDYERVSGFTVENRDLVTLTTLVWPVHSLESLLTSPTVLLQWLKAFLGDRCPEDMQSRVVEAISEADRDEELLASAISYLTTHAILAQQRRGVALGAAHGKAIVDATQAAQRQVRAEPAIWQQGKDRATFILQKIRDGLSGTAQGRFPTDICNLIGRTNLNRIGESIMALPITVVDLLDRMTQA